MQLMFPIVFAALLAGENVIEGRKGKALQEALAAAAFFKDEYAVREEFWEGKIKAGENMAIRHQLFRGHSYWFWLGTDSSKVKPLVKVYDLKGKSVDVEYKNDDRRAAVRVTPKKTGSYIIVISGESKEPNWSASWALAYGYL